MEKYNRVTYAQYIIDLQTSPEVLLDTPIKGVSNNFNLDYALMVINLARRLSKTYMNIGVLNFTDLIQEANLLFFKHWSLIKWNMVEKIDLKERQYFIWGYLKKSIRLGLTQTIRNQKDGVRIPLYKHNSDAEYVTDSITSIFPEFFGGVFRAHVEYISDYKNELLSEFLDDVVDQYLDRTFKGERNLKGIERSVITQLFGLDCPKKSLAEIAKYYGMTVPGINSIKVRALEKLQSEAEVDWVDKSVREALAFFVSAKGIRTNSNAHQWAADNLVWGLEEGRKTDFVDLSDAMKNKLNKNM